MKTIRFVAGSLLAAASCSTWALEGVYAGPQCLGMKFDFRKDGQVFITEVTGREDPGTYKTSGDKVAVNVPGDGPGMVLDLKGDDSVTLQVSGILGQPGRTLRCYKPLEAGGAALVDPKLVGCWKYAKVEVFKDEKTPPKEQTPDCVVAYSSTSFRQVCKVPGKPDAVTVARFAITKIGVMTSEITQATPLASSVGMRSEKTYSIAGDVLHTEAFPRQMNPDNVNAPWKVVGTVHRVEAAACR